jgi:hypothetical protein
MRTTVTVSFYLFVVAAMLPIATSAVADTITLEPLKDNSIYEEVDSNSNGSGEYLFSGHTQTPFIRRALLMFDVAGSLPEDATIESATLMLYCSRTLASDMPASLHRLLYDWGEAGSDAAGQEGMGAPAEEGDATWAHTFFNTEFWVTPGGDFDATASATIMVGFEGPYVWDDPQLTVDVQDWYNNPDTNFGWILIGDEIGYATAKRYNSRENPSEDTRPMLTIEYTTGVATEQETWSEIKSLYR